jgi:hypothetical protein
VNGDNLNELDSHLAQAPIKLRAMGVDPDTRQASLILMSSFTGKPGRWAQHNTEVLYNLNSVSQLVDFVKNSFVVKDYQAEHLQLLIKCEKMVLTFRNTSANSMTRIVLEIGNFRKMRFLPFCYGLA